MKKLLNDVCWLHFFIWRYYMVQEASTFYMYGCIEYVQVGNSWKCAENKRNLLSVDNGICIHAAVASKQFLYPFPSLVLICWVFGLSTGIIVLVDLTDLVLVLYKYNNTTWHRQFPLHSGLLYLLHRHSFDHDAHPQYRQCLQLKANGCLALAIAFLFNVQFVTNVQY